MPTISAIFADADKVILKQSDNKFLTYMHKTNIPESWTINQWIGQDSFTRLPAYGYRQGRARIPRTKIVCKAQVLLKTPTHLLKTPTLKRNAIRCMIMLKPRQIRLDISLKSETPGAFHDRLRVHTTFFISMKFCLLGSLVPWSRLWQRQIPKVNG